MNELAEDYPDETWLQAEEAKPDFTSERWHQYYWEAWHALRYDRAYGGMGGVEMPIPFIAVDAYARRNGIVGEGFDRLLRFVSVIDFAYLDIQRKATEKSHAKSKVNQNG